MDGRMDGRMDGGMDGRRDARTHGPARRSTYKAIIVRRKQAIEIQHRRHKPATAILTAQSQHLLLRQSILAVRSQAHQGVQSQPLHPKLIKQPLYALVTQ